MIDSYLSFCVVWRKFLTAEVEGDENVGWVWAQFSDTQYMLPVRLSKEAMETYYE